MSKRFDIKTEKMTIHLKPNHGLRYQSDLMNRNLFTENGRSI